MARSLFIQNSERPAVLRAQFRKLKDDLRDSGTMLDGPFQDQSGAIAKLSDDVGSRMKFGAHNSIVGAAIATLSPQNLPGGERSWLKVPFIVTPYSPPGICESAGRVANVEPGMAGSTPVRAVDMEGLTLVGVAVLRKLGFPAHFSYMHFDMENPKLKALRSMPWLVGSIPVGEPVPTILAMSPEPEFLTFLPPYAIPLPTHNAVAGFEVLDDAAVLSLMRMKLAYEQSISLMREIAAQALEPEGDGTRKAMGIGHLLHDAASIWTLPDASHDLASATSFINPKSCSLEMESVRMWAESRYAHNLQCRAHHSLLASEVMLSDEAKRMISDVLRQAVHDGSNDSVEIPVSLRDLECVPKLLAYLELSETLRGHLHARKDCPVILRMN
jgi:hypothetical protein